MIYMLRTCGLSGLSSHNFQYPTKVGEFVECTDWDNNPQRDCGGGLHGLPNGIGNANLIPQTDVRWQIYEVDEKDSLPLNNGKAKWRKGKLVFDCVGNDARSKAIEFLVAIGCPRIGIVWDKVMSGYSGQSTSGYSGQSTSGDSGQSTSGDSGQSTSGNYGQSTSGDSGQSTSGDSGQSTSGDSGQSTSGYSGQSTSGYYGQSITKLHGKVCGGPYAGLMVSWFDKSLSILRNKVGEVGCGDGSDGLLKANVWYKVNEDGRWVECEN